MLELANPVLSQTPLSSPVVVSLLGAFQITVNGKAIDTFRLNKSRALFAYLLVEGTHPLARTDLAQMFWPGYTTSSARASLRQALDDLRRLFDSFPLLRTSHHHIALAPDAPLWCDVLQFNALLTRWQQHQHLALAHCLPCQTRLQQALALVKGDFLNNLPDVASPAFNAWLIAQRAHFAKQLAVAQTALAQAIAPTGNLRPAFTSLIGRRTELAELAVKLHDPLYRCLTLLGPGGIGKTRLALALGEEQKAHFPDGVWLVELTAPAPGEAQADAAAEFAEHCQERIATTIGAALGLAFQGAMRPSAQVAAYLRDKTMLLLLDNFEQLIAGTALLLHLLATAPQLRILVNSRQRLPLQAQLVYPVEGLPMPPESAVQTPEQITEQTPPFTAYASVQLFIERAQNAGFGLALDAPTLTAISALCRLVAGSPWAIELAVGLLDHYSPIALWQAIQTDYRALTGPWLDLPPRLRSAEAVLRTMWGALTPHEATCLARCAVFRGGFIRAAAQAIGDMTAADLQALQHKSLLHPTGGDRFTLHELVRQFAVEQLAHDPVAQNAVLARHAAYYIALIQTQEMALVKHADAQVIIQAELDNVGAAWQWSAAQVDLSLLAQGANSLFTFYGLAGLYHEAIQYLESAIAGLRPLLVATPTDDTVRRLLALLLNHGADFYQLTGAFATSVRLAEEALTLGQQLADPALQSFAYHILTRVAQACNDLPAMQRWAEAGCTQARLAQRFDLLSECLCDLGILFTMQQQKVAISYFEEALHTVEGVANYYLEAHILVNLGMVQLLNQEYELARRYIQRASLLHQNLRDQEGRAFIHLALGVLWMEIGRYSAAQQEYRQAQEMFQIAANPYWLSWLQICNGYLHHLCGDPATARASVTLGYQIAQQSSGNRLFESLGLFYLGYVLIEQAEWEAAQTCFQQSLALQAAATWTIGTADANAGLAACLLAQAETAAAIEQVDTALDLLAQHGVAAASELFVVYWLCFQTLQSVADVRAMDVLRTAYQLLQACATQFEDPALRHAFLNDVAVNRRLVMAAQAVGLPL